MFQPSKLNLRMNKREYIFTAVAVIGGMTAGIIVYKYFWRKKRAIMLHKQKLDVASWITGSTIHIIRSPEEWDQVAGQLQEQVSEMKVVGLDCEWVTLDKSRQAVALLQLATQSRLVLLVRLCCMEPSQLPASLKALLADKKVLKVGVGVGDDAKKLMRDYSLTVAGCVDLRFLTSRVKPFQTLKKKSLKSMAEHILGVHFRKGPEIRCSDWEAQELSQDQVQYAAADAQVGVDIFTVLALTKSLGRLPDSPQPEESGVAMATLWPQARSLCQGLVDVPYREKGSSMRAPRPTDQVLTSSQSSTSLRSTPLKDSTKAYCVRQKPLYHSCRLLAPDGQLLCVCDEKKAQWYLEKDLADQVGETPLAVKLRFEPAGRPTSDRDYYAMEKANICVICGASDSFMRKYIIPQEYRKFFPTSLKEHRSHDVLLMCPSCHLACDLKEAELRQQLALECDAPLASGQTSRTFLNPELSKVKSAAKALLLNRSKIPEARVRHLEEVVMRHFGVTSLNDDLLNMAKEINAMEDNRDFCPHGKKVVDHMRRTVGLVEFERRCRQFFLDTAQPRFLPALWSVDHDNHKHLAVSVQELTGTCEGNTSGKLTHPPSTNQDESAVRLPRLTDSGHAKRDYSDSEESVRTGMSGCDSVSASKASS